MASLCRSAGLHIGDDLMPANTGNELGHFEDLHFHDFHKRVLRGNGCCPDGFVPNAIVTVPPVLREQARQLVAARRSLGRAWGWKDPRTVLLLRFWHELLPEARYVFMFRSPWEVVDSLYRRGVHEFLHTNPASALKIWSRYNNDIKEFAARYPDSCLLMSASRLVDDPDAAIATVSRRLGVPLTGVEPLCRREAFTTLRNSQRETFVRQLAPEAVAVYEELLAAESPERHRPKPARCEEPDSALALLELGMRDWFLDHERTRRVAHAESAARDAVAARDDVASLLAAEIARGAVLQESLQASTASLAAVPARLIDLEREVQELRTHVARLEHERESSPASQATAGAAIGAGDALTASMDALRDQIVVLTATLESGTRAVAARGLTDVELRDVLASLQVRLVALETSLEQALSATRLHEAALREQAALHHAVVTSNSWRLTRPLRAVRRWLTSWWSRCLHQAAWPRLVPSGATGADDAAAASGPPA
jgi:hypothetical protein